MADSITTFLGGVKPEVGASDDTWGGKLNADWDLFDAAIRSLVERANYAAGSGADDIAVTLDPAPSAYVEGMRVRFKAAADNTTSPTLNVSGLGAKALKYAGGGAIPAGGLKAGLIYTADYNGTEFTLPPPGATASAADVLAGISTILALTPAAFAGNKSLGANGYYQLPGGFTFQWGTSTGAIPGGSTFTATFPVAFANGCVFATAVPRNPTGDLHEDIQGLQWKAASQTQAQFFCQDGSQNNAGATWFALGF